MYVWQKISFDRFSAGMNDAARRYEEERERENGKIREALEKLWQRVGFTGTPPSSPR